MSSDRGLHSTSAPDTVVLPDASGPDHAPEGLGQPELDAIYRVSACTADVTGDDFFEALVRQLAAILDVRGAFVSLFTEDLEKMSMLAMWDGKNFMTDMVYDMNITPCREVAKGRVFHCPRGVRQQFPEDQHLAAMEAESYRGVPMVGPSGWHMGHLAVVGTRPLEAEPRFFALMRLFAVRAAAEIERIHAAKARARSEQHLRIVLQSTHDAIIHLDEGGSITLMNAAAERIFGCEAAQTKGHSFDRFLTEPLRQQLGAFYRAHASTPSTGETLWLPDRATAYRADGSSFRVEGSAAARHDGARASFTLVLRDIGERVQAERTIAQLARDNALLAEEVGREHPVGAIVGRSPAMTVALRHVEQVAPTDATVLILGESGTGKELFARAIHSASGRRERPLVRVNCAALPASLIESELFGHEKGSFTGANAMRMGRFECADKGTLFLDELGELPLALQPKLLRVLQEQELERVGSSNTRKVDVRIIAATNRDLPALVERGEFRDDLYYRLMGFPIQLPALREHPDDIEPLARVFMERYARQIGRRVERIGEAGLRRLRAYAWPGNVRELQSVIERAVILSSTEGLEVEASLAMVPGAVAPVVTTVEPSHSGTPEVENDLVSLSLQDMERRHIERVLRQTGGVIDGPRGAAKLLELNASTLRSRMRKLGIDRLP